MIHPHDRKKLHFVAQLWPQSLLAVLTRYAVLCLGSRYSLLCCLLTLPISVWETTSLQAMADLYEGRPLKAPTAKQIVLQLKVAAVETLGCLPSQRPSHQEVARGLLRPTRAAASQIRARLPDLALAARGRPRRSARLCAAACGLEGLPLRHRTGPGLLRLSPQLPRQPVRHTRLSFPPSRRLGARPPSPFLLSAAPSPPPPSHHPQDALPPRPRASPRRDGQGEQRRVRGATRARGTPTTRCRGRRRSMATSSPMRRTSSPSLKRPRSCPRTWSAFRSSRSASPSPPLTSRSTSRGHARTARPPLGRALGLISGRRCRGRPI